MRFVHLTCANFCPFARESINQQFTLKRMEINKKIKKDRSLLFKKQKISTDVQKMLKKLKKRKKINFQLYKKKSI